MTNSNKKCKYCKQYVTEWVTLPVGVFCSYDSAIKWSSAKRVKDNEKALKKRNVAFKKKVKSKAKWLEELQAVFNQYVRIRDINEGCISCDKPSNWNGQWHASHYYSRGHSSSLRFNLHNVHKSCSVCNSHLSGNIGEYKPMIIKKIGLESFEQITSIKSDIKSFNIEWIERAIKIARRAIKIKKARIN